MKRVSHPRNYFWQENIAKQQFLALGCTSQLQSGMHQSFTLGLEQQFRDFSWIHNDYPCMTSPGDSHMLQKRETKLPDSGSFGNLSCYFDTVEKPEIAEQDSGFLNEILRTVSLRSELIGLKNETSRNEKMKTESEFLKDELIKTESVKNQLIKTESLRNKLTRTGLLRNELIKAEFFRNELIKAEFMRNELWKAESLSNGLIKTGSFRNDLTDAKSLRLQLYEQCSYPKNNFCFLLHKKFQPAQQMNLQQQIGGYCAEGNFEPQSAYEPTRCVWSATFEPSTTSNFDGQLFLQKEHPLESQEVDGLGSHHIEATYQPSLIN